MTKTDACVFCGYKGSDFAPEHWIPNWLSRELIPEHATHVIHNRPGHSWPSRRFEFTVPHVCKACNHGWMSDLEARTKPHVLPFILGAADESNITGTGLELIVSWSYLKVLSLELGRTETQNKTHDARERARSLCAVTGGR